MHDDRVALCIRERAFRQTERSRQLARVREARRLAFKAFVLDAQHHHDVRTVEAILETGAHANTLARLFTADELDAARDQRQRCDDANARAELRETKNVRPR